jgi:hypothetical protein
MTVAIPKSSLESSPKSSYDQVEYGDFQTPAFLAEQVVQCLVDKIKHYTIVVEPTCGQGNLLMAALKICPSLTHAIGIEINPQYVEFAKNRAWSNIIPSIYQANIFELNLPQFTRNLAKPILFLGNPPWVTSAGVGTKEGVNLPKKNNARGLSGLDSLTGKSNFDVSEWILMQLLDQVAGTRNACAMLIKSSVARKIIAYAHRHNLNVCDFEMYTLDAKKAFDVSVSACLFFFRGTLETLSSSFKHVVFPSLESKNGQEYHYLNGNFISDVENFLKTEIYDTRGQGAWRSGIKHDLAQVMELRPLEDIWLNGMGENADIETDLVFPFFKSSDIAKGSTAPRFYTIVTQRSIGASTDLIAHQQPKTWAYLKKYQELFARRKSSIYKGKPSFSIFGVGEYSFFSYKIAISGLYKRLQFTLLEPIVGRCPMVDDTCYFLGFNNYLSAYIHTIALNMQDAHHFFDLRITWDDKRPIKKDLLDSFDLEKFIINNIDSIKAKLVSGGLFSEQELKVWFDRFLQTKQDNQPMLF